MKDINMHHAIELAAMSAILEAQRNQTDNNWFVSWDDIRKHMWFPPENMDDLRDLWQEITDKITDSEMVIDCEYNHDSEQFDILLYGDATFYDGEED